MNLRERLIQNEYFEWLYALACARRYSTQISFRKLLMRLHRTEFIYSIPYDENRAEDGIDMRRRFIMTNGYEESYDEVIDALYGPCSVLELIVALAIRCEETIMDDPKLGDRTGQWLWLMVVNLGLGSMTDAEYDREYVDERLQIFLNREYESNGEGGGLFVVKNCDVDLREVEIWRQLCRYLNSIN